MSYKSKPQLRLYKFLDSVFVLQAIIDDFQEISFERNLYQAGTFTISINYNIPNALLFERGMFVQFGNDPYDFGEIITIRDSIGQDGKGSQIRTITGYDSRYILKRRVIKNMNSNGLWVMTAKGELCLRNLIKDQCGSGAESKRQLPIINTIPASTDAIGKEYSVSEQFTNLYEVCKTIATQSEIGWRLAFDGTSLTLECYEGTDRSQTVQFSTSFDSLANGEFSDSSESFSNAIYVGGKGDNEERDIYEGENGTPSGLDRFESFDNQSSMTTESEYEAEALSMLTQYGQTIQMSGNGLAKCPYIYKEQYDVGDLITVAFSGKSAVVQILSVTEHWTWGNYNIQFSFGKPQNNLSEQLQLMLRKIQSASNKEKATESVKWYNVANVNLMSASDVTFNTIGFTGTLTANKTFTFYLDDEKTGAKSYNIYVKNLSGNYNLTLTTGRAGKTNYVLKGGVNLTGRILVDDEGNITSQSVTATSVIESGNNQPATSGAVAEQTEVTKSSGNTPYSQRVNADKDRSFINKLIGASFAVNQLVKNGNFNSTSDWTVNPDRATFSVANNVGSFTNFQETNPFITQSRKFYENHKYLLSIEVNSTQTVRLGLSLRYNWDIVSSSAFNLTTKWALYSVVLVANANTNRCAIIFTKQNFDSSTAVRFKNVNLIDLTQMFGSAIADRIYAMEQATEGSGVAWIKSFGFFDKSYYSTDEGSIQSAKPSAHKVSASVVSSWKSRNVATQYAVSLIADAVLKPNTAYRLYFRGASNAGVYINEYIFGGQTSITLNGGLQSVSYTTLSILSKDSYTADDNGWYIFKNRSGNTIVPNFTEFYIVEEGANAEPSFSQIIPLADIELRGIPKLDVNNNLYFDGDIYYPNGDVIRKYGLVDLGSLTWGQQDIEQTSCSTFWSNDIVSLVKSPSANSEVANIVCEKYSTVSFSAYFASPVPKGVSVLNNGQLRISDPDNTYSKNTATFKTAMNGVYLIYELATPTKETVAGYSNPHTLIRKGAEEFVDNRTIPIPTGHETEYAQLPSWLSNNVIFL